MRGHVEGLALPVCEAPGRAEGLQLASPLRGVHPRRSRPGGNDSNDEPLKHSATSRWRSYERQAASSAQEADRRTRRTRQRVTHTVGRSPHTKGHPPAVRIRRFPLPSRGRGAPSQAARVFLTLWPKWDARTRSIRESFRKSFCSSFRARLRARHPYDPRRPRMRSPNVPWVRPTGLAEIVSSGPHVQVGHPPEPPATFCLHYAHDLPRRLIEAESWQ